jgi:hypothetical protein
MGKAVYIPPKNETINSIEVNEIVQGNTTVCRIFVVLKADVPYKFDPDEAGLRVEFPT